MFKKSLIIILIILVGFFVYQYLKSPGEILAEPQETVEGFYDFWVSYQEKQPGQNPITDRAYKTRDEVTASLAARLDEIIDSFDGDSGFDPILCAQDLPSFITFEQINKIEDSASVKALQDFYGIKKEMMISLKLIDNSWKIDNIECLTRENIYTQEQSRQIAELWIMNASPTYTFDGMNLVLKESLAFDLTDCRSCYQFVYDFESRQAGYGDRTDQMLAQVITPHNIVVVVENGAITKVMIDGVYDDLNQKMIQE